MLSFSRLGVALWLLAGFPGVVRAADPVVSDSADDAAARAAVAKSLAYLGRAGQAWIDEKGCVSCHHVPLMIWSHHAARAKGIDVDADLVSRWREWFRQDSLSRRNLYRLSTEAMARPPAAALPEPIRQKLNALLEQVFATKGEFTARLAEVLSDAELAAHQRLLEELALLPLDAAERSGGGLDVLAQWILGNADAPFDQAGPKFFSGVREMIVQRQLQDGSWTPGSQLATLRRWPKPAADQATTMWAALALAADASGGRNFSAEIAKARQYVEQQPPQPQYREWLAARLLFEARTGTAAAAVPLRDQLLQAVNADGGVAWEAAGSSDPYTTGLVLYVLAEPSLQTDAAPLARAGKFLVSSQQPDGSWLTPARNISKTTDPARLAARDEIYHYWGTGWAALGLLATLPAPGP